MIKKNGFNKLCFAFILIITSSVSVFAQSDIPKEYRGTEEAIARGVLNGNAIQTNFRNHGEHSKWGDTPWGIWPVDKGGRHIDGFGFFMAAQVVGEKAKWSQYYGEGARDTTLNPVIINYKQAGFRQSPRTGDAYGWLPLNGFNNENRTNDLGQKELVPAISDDKRSWPEFWPDRLEETDEGWKDSWNGFRGRGLVNGDLETFYMMDDFSDLEYAIGLETDGPHSEWGVYIPSPSDSTIGGLGTQVEVRHFQFNDVFSSDMLFTQYRITNVSEKDLEEVWTGMALESGLGFEEIDDNAEFLPEENLVIFWDSDGVGEPTFAGGGPYELGYVGLLILEYSTIETNALDDDNDGIIDESKFNGPGELIEGKAAIDTYLEANYNMERFRQVYVDLENFPAYQAEYWWTGDEDMDWVAFEDLDGDGIQNEDEQLIDDVGRDGLAPHHENYPGPDEGEGDGIPTHGEPNFGELDMLEAENIPQFSFVDLGIRSTYASGSNLRDDTWLFGQIKDHQFESEPEPISINNEEPFMLGGIGPYSLKQNTSAYFTIALIFGEDREELLKNVRYARLIHEIDYGQSPFYTIPISNEEVIETPEKFSLSQNYPNPFNPTTNIEFSLSKSAPVTLTVFDITGRQVQSLITNKSYPAGTHSVQFDAGNLSSGVYMYRLEVAGEVFTKKLTLIK